MNIIEFLENFPSYEKVQVKAINEDESTHNYHVPMINKDSTPYDNLARINIIEDIAINIGHYKVFDVEKVDDHTDVFCCYPE